MIRVLLVAALGLAATAGAASARTLQVYFIDVEGGQATLIVTPSGKSMLIDAGYAGRGVSGGRDAARIVAAARDAHVERIDYLLITHFHPDHVGGVPELAAKLPIDTFIDYGEPLGTDRMSLAGFRNYEPIRADHPHLQPKPGDRLPIPDVEAEVLSAAGAVLAAPLRGGGQATPECDMLEDHPDDGTENYRSIGFLLTFGAFRFLDLGDLSGHTLDSLVCPVNLIGRVSVYLVAHHGNYDSNVPALVSALRPRVAIMNNGPTKGADPSSLYTLTHQPGLENLWQLHASRHERAENAADAFIANVDDGETHYWLKLTASDTGTFTVSNGRNGFSKTYTAGGATRIQ